VETPIETELIEFAGWTAKVRRTGDGPGRLLLLIHGYTGDENSMWVFARGLPRRYEVLAPRAPHPAVPTGYSWQPPTAGRELELDGVRGVVQDLGALVDAYSDHRNLPAKSFDVMGFSQGGAVAIALGMLSKERIGRIAVLAGFAPANANSVARSRPLQGVRIFMAHGSKDELVDIEYARASARLLETAGAELTICEDEVGHKVSAGCLRGLQSFLA
jgi:phospholipase/carboxylesterase